MADNGWTVQTLADFATDTFKYQVTTAEVKSLIPSIYLKAPKNSPVTEEEAALVLSALASKAGKDFAKESEEGPPPEIEEEGTPSAPGGMLAKFEQAEAVGLSKKVLIGWLEGADKKELRRAGHFWFGLDPANSPRSLKQNMIEKVENWATDPTGFDLDKLPDFSDEMWEAIDNEVKKRIAAAKEQKRALEEGKKARKQAPITAEAPAKVEPNPVLPTELDEPNNWETSIGLETIDTQPVQTTEVMEDLEEIPHGSEVEEQIPDEAEIEEEPQPEDGQTDRPDTPPEVEEETVRPEILVPSEILTYWEKNKGLIIAVAVLLIINICCYGLMSLIILLKILS